jgi:hypothetical protein
MSTESARSARYPLRAEPAFDNIVVGSPFSPPGCLQLRIRG